MFSLRRRLVRSASVARVGGCGAHREVNAVRTDYDLIRNATAVARHQVPHLGDRGRRLRVRASERKDGRVSQSTASSIGWLEFPGEVARDTAIPLDPMPVATLRSRHRELQSPRSNNGAELSKPGVTDSGPVDGASLRQQLLVIRCKVVPEASLSRYRNTMMELALKQL